MNGSTVDTIKLKIWLITGSTYVCRNVITWLMIGMIPAIKLPMIGIMPPIKSAIDWKICMITGAAACIPLIIPGIMVVTSKLSTCSTTGTIFAVTKLTNSPAALTTFWNTPANVSKTATPLSPKISLILSLAAPKFPSEKTFLIVSPTFVTTCAILSKIASPVSPKIFPIAFLT